MTTRQIIWMLIMLSSLRTVAWAQDGASPSSGSAPDNGSPQEPVPAYGQENTPPPISENPPLSGMDQPGLEKHGSPLSYLQLGGTVSEAADSNIANVPGGSTSQSLTRVLGNATLQRLWRNYDLAVDYVGGFGYYNVKNQGLKSLQQMDLEQKITWKRGQVLVRDNFSYLPEGGFGGVLSTEGIASISNTAFAGLLGGEGLGGLGQSPRILNISLAEASETLSPRSAITVASGYAFTHFYGNDESTGSAFIGGSQVSVEAGYNRLLSVHTQVALVYAYQGFDYTVFGTAFHSHVVEGVLGKRISGRMDLQIGVGPQITLIDAQGAVCSDPLIPLLLCLSSGDTIGSTTVKDTRLGAAGRAQLHYKFPVTSLKLSYQRLLTSGSGLFAGAQSDVGVFSIERPLSRVWGSNLDIGVAHNSRVQPLTPKQVMDCAGPGTSPSSACPANNATTYIFGFAEVAVHRSFGREFRGFASYRFNQLAFDSSFCATPEGCSRISNRNLFTVGLNWTPKPMRID